MNLEFITYYLDIHISSRKVSFTKFSTKFSTKYFNGKGFLELKDMFLSKMIVINLLRKDWKGPNIFNSLGYKYSFAYNHHNKLMEELFGLDTESARIFFKTKFLGSAEK